MYLCHPFSLFLAAIPSNHSNNFSPALITTNICGAASKILHCKYIFLSFGDFYRWLARFSLQKRKSNRVHVPEWADCRLYKYRTLYFWLVPSTRTKQEQVLGTWYLVCLTSQREKEPCFLVPELIRGWTGTGTSVVEASDVHHQQHVCLIAARLPGKVLSSFVATSLPLHPAFLYCSHLLLLWLFESACKYGAESSMPCAAGCTDPLNF